MYLKSLELHGFKSFPNRTVLTFERGTTVVVGPNGSGKSNISDAMRWVLGELSSRNIRGTKMEDVIFGGTDDRRPMGFAEVSVTFDNTDKAHALNLPYDEVVVTRRYYRAGESEYFINRKNCRLKDIYELFMNTGVGREGYSIIGQGRIAEILSKKSEDRRNFFEEAAGISKFRFKKEEAERKLQATEENMLRVRDILGELESRVGPLKRESEKAKRYFELYDQKKQADVSLWLYDTQKLRTDIATAKDAVALSENELNSLNESLASLEAQNDRLDEEQKKNRLLSENLLQQNRESTKDLNRLENEFHLLENDTQHRQETITACRASMEEDKRAILALDAEQRGEDGKLLGMDEQVESLRDEHLALLAEQQEKMQAAQTLEVLLANKLQESNALETRAVDVRVRLNVLKSTKESGNDKANSLAAEIARYEAEGEKLKAEAARCENSAASFKEKIAGYESEIAGAGQKIEELTGTRASVMDGLARLQGQRSSFLQRADALQRMEEHFEGYNNSVRFIMQHVGHIPGAGKIYGPLSRLITTAPAHTVAIETALGANIQNIVVDQETTAKAAINFLKENRAGRATFYPVSAIRASGETEEVRRAATYAGYVGRADQLVQFAPAYGEIVAWLLARTVVFDTLDHATDAARSLHYRVKMVTLDGQVINAGGSFTGGSAKHDSGVMSRPAEIEKLQKDAEAVAAQIQQDEARVATLDAQMRDLHQVARDAEQQKDLLLAMARTQFAALDSANAKWEANLQLTNTLRADREALLHSDAQGQNEMALLEEELRGLEEQIQAITTLREEREIERNALLDEREALGQKANDVQIHITELRGEKQASLQRKETAVRRIEELKEDTVQQQARIEEQEALLAQHKADMARIQQEREVLAQRLADIDQNRGAVEADNDDYDRRLGELKIQIRNKYNQKDLTAEAHSRNAHKLERLQDEYDRLSSRLYDDYELTAEQARQLDYPPVTADNHSAFVQVQTECKQKIKSLGSVNTSAIAEYDEVKDRYETMSEQVADMTRSRDELMAIVEKLEDEMKTSFVSAFAEINKNFGVVFRELFGGGQAELSLTDPDDVLRCGIEIKAAPPGKIIKNLSLLSGGEQAFVACALFFAILKVNPTPFCLLDEIEAALDEVNVYRLGEYIRRFCGETQFILITHRRGTMQIADRLYGVTMPERGISRVIALDVNEIESKNKEFTDGLL